jgi:ribonuclease HI
MKYIEIFSDASYRGDAGSAFGCVIKINKSRISQHNGLMNGIKSSVHAELAGIRNAIKIAREVTDNYNDHLFHICSDSLTALSIINNCIENCRWHSNLNNNFIQPHNCISSGYIKQETDLIKKYIKSNDVILQHVTTKNILTKKSRLIDKCDRLAFDAYLK